MRTVVIGARPVELEALIEKRRRLGQDLFDEVWEGDYHMNPGPHGRHGRIDHQLAVALDGPAEQAGLVPTGLFNVGDADDFRVPDRGLLRPGDPVVFFPTAAMVIEIVSPGDESYAKLGFYFARGVEEVLLVDPEARTVRLLGRADDAFADIERSGLIDLVAADLCASLRWPD